MVTTLTDAGESDRLPLCCRYLLAAICDVPLRTPDASTPMRWGLGALPDGKLEILGVWPPHGRNTSAGQAICSDLRRRGVEVIHYLAGSGSDGLNAALCSAFSDAIVLRDDWHPSAADLGRRHTRILRSASGAVHELRRRINRAVARRASFPSSAVAASFISAKLVALEPSIVSFETTTCRRTDVRVRRPQHL